MRQHVTVRTFSKECQNIFPKKKKTALPLWTEDVSMEKNARKVEKSWFPSSDERRNVTQLV